MLMAHGCRASTSRVDSARARIAVRHSSPARGVENSECTRSSIPSRDRMIVRHVLVKCFLVTPDFNIADYFSVKVVDGEFVDLAPVVVLGCRGDREHGVGESLAHPRAGPG